ncbi:hypothetical protein R1sor_010906 [Riccia sorocarpa]|uniref:Uncharacterized protein n=1 Tax=Riccia sorocarpa TaxID=122646 RepID=A0ABD3I389_9MARC
MCSDSYRIASRSCLRSTSWRYSALTRLKLINYVSRIQHLCVAEDIFWWTLFNNDADGERLLIRGLGGTTCVIGWHEIQVAFGAQHDERDEFRPMKIAHKQFAALRPGDFLPETVDSNVNKKLVSDQPYEEINYYKEAVPYGPTYYLMSVIAEALWYNVRSPRITSAMVFAYMRSLHGFSTNWAKALLHGLRTEILYLQKHARALVVAAPPDRTRKNPRKRQRQTDVTDADPSPDDTTTLHTRWTTNKLSSSTAGPSMRSSVPTGSTVEDPIDVDDAMDPVADPSTLQTELDNIVAEVGGFLDTFWQDEWGHMWRPCRQRLPEYRFRVYGPNFRRSRLTAIQLLKQKLVNTQLQTAERTIADLKNQVDARTREIHVTKEEASKEFKSNWQAKERDWQALDCQNETGTSRV